MYLESQNNFWANEGGGHPISKTIPVYQSILKHYVKTVITLFLDQCSRTDLSSRFNQDGPYYRPPSTDVNVWFQFIWYYGLLIGSMKSDS